MFSVPEGSEGRELGQKAGGEEGLPWSLGGRVGSGEDFPRAGTQEAGVTGRGAAGWSSEHEVGRPLEAQGDLRLGGKEGRSWGGSGSSQASALGFSSSK